VQGTSAVKASASPSLKCAAGKSRSLFQNCRGAERRLHWDIAAPSNASTHRYLGHPSLNYALRRPLDR